MGKRKDPMYSFGFGPEEYAAWWDQGKCKDHPHADYWFADTKNAADEAAYARAVCAVCPVASRCFSYAMSHPEVEGIWGGVTAPERRRARETKKDPTLCARQLHSRAEHGMQRVKVNPEGGVSSAGVRCRECDRMDKQKAREAA